MGLGYLIKNKKQDVQPEWERKMGPPKVDLIYLRWLQQRKKVMGQKEWDKTSGMRIQN